MKNVEHEGLKPGFSRDSSKRKHINASNSDYPSENKIRRKQKNKAKLSEPSAILENCLGAR